jgi:hypothetical protein
LEFGNVDFFGGRKTRRTRRKTLEARERINNKIQLTYDAEYGNRTLGNSGVEASAHTATPTMLPFIMLLYNI